MYSNHTTQTKMQYIIFLYSAKLLFIKDSFKSIIWTVNNMFTFVLQTGKRVGIALNKSLLESLEEEQRQGKKKGRTGFLR